MNLFILFLGGQTVFSQLSRKVYARNRSIKVVFRNLRSLLRINKTDDFIEFLTFLTL